MRIATWNLESLRRLTPERDAAFRQAMANVDADVWVLTETWNDFPPLLGYQLVAQSSEATDLKRWPNRCWVSIWARVSLAAYALQVHSQPDRLACGRFEMPGRRDIVVIGTVLPWGNDTLWSGAAGFCAALAAQATEWERLRGGPDSCTFLVAGDFNLAIPYQRYYGSRRGAEALAETMQRHNLVCLTPGNEPMKEEPRIDHICMERNGLKSSVVPQAGAWTIPMIDEKPVTDHVGVFVDLDLSNRS